MSGDAGAVKAHAGKGGGNFHAPPPPDKPKDWKAIGILEYRNEQGVREYRVKTQTELAEELRIDLHENHGIGSAHYK